MVNWNDVNPFSRRESHSPAAINTYKVLTGLTWLLSVLVSVYYTVQPPHDLGARRAPFWDINNRYPSAFTMNPIMGSIFWVFLFVLQFGYLTRLFSENPDTVNAASSVGSHFIANNLLHTAFVLLFVHGHFIWAEVMLVANFINLSSLYFRHNKYPRSIHTPVVSGPLAWTFVGLYWNGAIMIHHPDNQIARIFGNIFIWSILAYGMFFLSIYNDYTMGLSLSVLAAAIGVGQFLTHAAALQWIFAFVIMGVLFLATLGVAVPVWTGREIKWRRRAEPTDSERAPLLNEES